ncbi:hypothetical protein [Halalkalicoccus ordinarius]|uniref:hypothetical protein n=1 Tax=Halalkalicoccus ordinarius TaxID=3116651 RepID=UPI00300F09F6
MSLTVRQRSTNGPESWYGEPQHDVCEDDGSIEFERYGEPNHEQPPEPPEFVPGIEYRPGRAIDGPARAKRTMPVLRIGD